MINATGATLPARSSASATSSTRQWPCTSRSRAGRCRAAVTPAAAQQATTGTANEVRSRVVVDVYVAESATQKEIAQERIEQPPPKWDA